MWSDAVTATPARRGMLLILSSPSGAGKSTITRQLIQDEPGLQLSISVTTRPQRPSEIDGKHYHFIDRAEFEQLRAAGDLIEWAEVHGNFYGTPRKPVEAALARGQDMLFDIDWQGTAQILEKMKADAVTVFILPPSMAELKSRLERRAEDTADVIARRLNNARDEIARWPMYDYVIVNDQLQAAYGKVRAILAAERVRRVRVTGLESFVGGLLADA